MAARLRRGVLTMNSRRPINKLACCGLVLLLVFGFYASRGAAGQVVSGVYKVTQTTDLGNEVGVTMQIRLMNASEKMFFETHARVREFLRHGTQKDETVG